MRQRAIDESAAVTQGAVISLRARIDVYESDGELQRNKRFGRRVHSKTDDYLRLFVRVAKFNGERALLRLVALQAWLDEHIGDSGDDDNNSGARRLAGAMFRRALEARIVQVCDELTRSFSCLCVC